MKIGRLTLGLIMLALLSAPAQLVSNPGNQVQIKVYGIQVDTDTRPDKEGQQYSMTAVRGFPTAIHTTVGAPGHPISDELAAGLRVKATIHGPAYEEEGEPLEALPNQPFEIADLPVEGDYEVSGIRLEDVHGRTIMTRNPALPPVTIHVIDKLPREFDRTHRALDDLLFRHLELMLAMDSARGNEHMDTVAIGVPDRLVDLLDIRRIAASKAADHGAEVAFGNALHRFKITRRGRRETRFDKVDVKLR